MLKIIDWSASISRSLTTIYVFIAHNVEHNIHSDSQDPSSYLSNFLKIRYPQYLQAIYSIVGSLIKKK